ncbi:MAG: hypothetical protein ACK4IX_09090 [Candidatus Sericytochromatia bacterium]
MLLKYDIISNPPRKISFKAILKIIFSRPFTQIGWLFGGISLIIFISLAFNSDLTSFIYYRGNILHANGTIIESKRTSFAGGQKQGNRRTPIFANYFSFSTQDGQIIKGVSYAMGTSLNVGQNVLIDYPEKYPKKAKISGMKIRPISAFSSMIAFIFPLVGFYVVFLELNKSILIIKLLSLGKISEGKFKCKNIITNKKNNTFEYIFSFIYNNKEIETIYKTHLEQDITSDSIIPIFYSPQNPKDSISYLEIPKSIKYENNEFTVSNSDLLINLIIPTLIILISFITFVLNLL